MKLLVRLSTIMLVTLSLYGFYKERFLFCVLANREIRLRSGPLVELSLMFHGPKLEEGSSASYEHLTHLETIPLRRKAKENVTV